MLPLNAAKLLQGMDKWALRRDGKSVTDKKKKRERDKKRFIFMSITDQDWEEEKLLL